MLLASVLTLFLQNYINPIRIAVIDTGYDTLAYTFQKCDEEQDFTSSGINDSHGHGTNITEAIGNRLSGDYCIIPVKYNTGYTDNNNGPFFRALDYVSNLKKVDIVNLSVQGVSYLPEEKILLDKILSKGTIIVAAAGNYHRDLGVKCDTFPACSDNRIVTVGALDQNGNIARFSNYGSYIKAWELGVNITGGNYKMSGTSQAAALRTARIAQELINQRKKNVEQEIYYYRFNGLAR